MDKGRNILLAITTVVLAGLYIYFLSPGVFSADSGDLLAAIAVGGVTHPPGYPLFTILGVIFSFLPGDLSLAFKVGLLSPIFSSLTVVFTFLICYKIWKRPIPALISVLTLAFSYPFWLYSEVVEVFPLMTLLSSVLLFLAVKLEDIKDENLARKLVCLLFLFFGLSLSHHHLILTLLPSFIYLLVRRKDLFKKKFLILYLLFLILGLLPYLYVPVSAARMPAINWDNAVNLPNFWRLITRGDYGVFKVGTLFGPHIWQRFFSVLSLFYFLYLDWLVVGLILTTLGFYYFFKKNRRLSIFFLLGFLFCGPIFVFYGSFPLSSSFFTGIFERFLILPSLFLTIFLAGGINYFASLAGGLVKKNKKLLFLFEGIFLILPSTLFIRNLPRVDMRNFYLGNNFAYDILDTLKDKGILFLAGDVELFNTQYIYYMDQKYQRRGIKLVPTNVFFREELLAGIAKYYPELHLPKSKEDDPFAHFIKENAQNFPIFSVFKPPDVGEYSWYPLGLLWKLEKESGVGIDEVIQENKKVWESYHDPLKTKKALWEGLLIADLIQKYGLAHLGYGKFLLSEGKLKMAESEFKIAKDLSPDVWDTHKYLGIAFSGQKKCDEAEDEFNLYVKLTKEEPEGYSLLATNAKECFRNEEKTVFYQKIYQEKVRTYQHSLEKL